MTWPIASLIITCILTAAALYVVRLLLAPRESARNAELLKKLAMLEAKSKALEGREEKRPVFPFHQGAR